MRGDTVRELCEKVNYSSPAYCAEPGCESHLLGHRGWFAKNLNGYICDSCK